MSYGENIFKVENGLSAVRFTTRTNDVAARLNMSLRECFGSKPGFRIRSYAPSDDQDTRQVGARLFYTREIRDRFEGVTLGRKLGSLRTVIDGAFENTAGLTADTEVLSMVEVVSGISPHDRAYIAVRPDEAGQEHLAWQRKTVLNAVEDQVRVKRGEWEPEEPFEIKLVTAPPDTSQKVLRSVGNLMADYFPLEFQFGETVFEPDPRRV